MLPPMPPPHTPSCPRGTSLLARAASALSVSVAVLVGVCAPAGAAPDSVNGPWVPIAGVYGSQDPVDFTAAGTPQPGVSILQSGADGAVTTCTIGWAVMSARRDVGYLTAGHCDRTEGAPLWMYTDVEGAAKDLMPLQNSERGSDENGRAYDAALFFLPPDDQTPDSYGVNISDGVRMRGVLSVRQAKALSPGTPVCMNGSRSGITCGPLIGADDTELEWGGAAVHGDSGAPVFVVNADGDALAIGTLSGGPAVTDNFATYLEPVLSRLKLRALVDGVRS